MGFDSSVFRQICILSSIGRALVSKTKGSRFEAVRVRQSHMRIPEWSNGAVCKTVVRGFKSHSSFQYHAAVAQLVEYLLAKQDVTSSNLVSRSKQDRDKIGIKSIRADTSL